MSYGRDPFYIYDGGDYLFLDGTTVGEDVINAFLYKILLTGRRDELIKRLQCGKKVWGKTGMEDQEDEIFKKLLGE